MQREEAEAKREARQREVTALKKQDLAIETTSQLIALVTEAALIAAGFHTHKRQWRKKRYDLSDC